MIEDNVVGGVVRLADLLQDHGALPLELLGVESRVLEDVRQNVERQRDVFLEYFCVIGCAFARCVGVKMTANRFNLFGDREGAAAFGSLERHVFEKMRDPIDLRRLVPRADIDPDAQ